MLDWNIPDRQSVQGASGLARLWESAAALVGSNGVTNVALLDSSRLEGMAASEATLWLVTPITADDTWCRTFASRLGRLIEFVAQGEGLYSCLFADPLLHIELRVSDSTPRRIRKLLGTSNQRPLWSRLGSRRPFRGVPVVSDAESRSEVSEVSTRALFWISAYTGVTKLHRGETFESLRQLTIMRAVIASRIRQLEGCPDLRPLRQFERCCPAWVRRLSTTVPQYNIESCADALRNTIQLYLDTGKADGASNGKADRGIGTALERALSAPNRSPSISTETLVSQYLHRPLSRTHIPAHTEEFLSSALRVFQQETDVLGIAIGGSWLGPGKTTLTGDLDTYSDVDLYVLVDDRRADEPKWQLELATAIAPAHVFTRPSDRCLTTLYVSPLLRVDLNFLSGIRFDDHFDNPEVLWERNGRLTELLGTSSSSQRSTLWPQRTRDWIDSRFWMAIFDSGERLSKGEMFQVLSDLSLLRSNMLAPLLSLVQGELSRDVRRFEFRFPEYIESFRKTVPDYGREPIWQALEACIFLYTSLRSQLPGCNDAAGPAEKEVRQWLNSRRQHDAMPVN